MTKEKTWMILAIIFMVLFLVESGILLLGYISLLHEEKQTNICYYDICNEYPQALYENDVCTCYDYDVLGQIQIVNEEYMG